MTSGPITLCASCARLGPNADGTGNACAAFPEGIPDAIDVEGFDHRDEFPGDNGVRYEMAAGAELRLAAYEEARTT